MYHGIVYPHRDIFIDLFYRVREESLWEDRSGIGRVHHGFSETVSPRGGIRHCLGSCLVVSVGGSGLLLESSG